MRPWLLLAALLACAPAPALAQSGPPAPPAVAQTAAERRALTQGRALVADFYAVRVERLWQAFTAEARTRWGSLEDFRAFREAGVQTYGAERRVVRERVLTSEGLTYYVRSATFEGDPQTVWALVLAFDAAGRVQLFGIAAERGVPPGETAWVRLPPEG